MIKFPKVIYRAVEEQYDCLADVYEMRNTGDGFDDDELTPVKIIGAMPCRISTKSLGPISSSEGIAPQVEYELRLFCSSLYDIPPGCRFLVEDRTGRKKEYKNSGDPFTNYQTHQAISIKRDKFI